MRHKVSTYWRIMNIRWSITNWTPNSRWYMNLCIYDRWKYKSFMIHRLVMIAFVWPSKLQVNHKNWDKTDNRLENLEYCTASENVKHSYHVLWRVNPSWKEHYKSIPVVQYNMNMNKIFEWDSLTIASNTLNIDRSAISKVCRGKRNSTWWYKWRYKSKLK